MSTVSLSRPQQMADHTTPLVKNCGYVAAVSSEVNRNFLERTLLGKTVLMYDTEDGKCVFKGNVVHLVRSLLDSPAPDIYRVPIKLNNRIVERYSDGCFASPALHYAHACIVNKEVREGEQETEPHQELSFGPDRPGIAMRKILLKLAKEESWQQ